MSSFASPLWAQRRLLRNREKIGEAESDGTAEFDVADITVVGRRGVVTHSPRAAHTGETGPSVLTEDLAQRSPSDTPYARPVLAAVHDTSPSDSTCSGAHVSTIISSIESDRKLSRSRSKSNIRSSSRSCSSSSSSSSSSMYVRPTQCLSGREAFLFFIHGYSFRPLPTTLSDNHSSMTEVNDSFTTEVNDSGDILLGLNSSDQSFDQSFSFPGKRESGETARQDGCTVFPTIRTIRTVSMIIEAVSHSRTYLLTY